MFNSDIAARSSAERKHLRRHSLQRLLGTTVLAAGGLCAASAAQAQGEAPDEIVVVGNAEFFRPQDQSSATKFDLAIQETPQAITVLTDDLLENFGAENLTDIQKFTAGIHGPDNATASTNFFFGNVQIRGFYVDARSGFKINGFSTLREFQPDLVVVDRVEVLKGPSAIVFGVNNYGGSINTILKRPEGEFGVDLSGSYGTHENYRAEVDVTGPLTQDGRLRGRLIGAYSYEESVKDFYNFERIPVAGMLEYDLTSNTTAYAHFIYQTEKGRDDFGFIAERVENGTFGGAGREPFSVPRNVFAADPNLADTERDSWQGMAEIRHEFDNGYNLSIKSGYTKNKTDYIATYLYNYGYFVDVTRDLNANVYYKEDHRTAESFDAELSFGGEFELFGQDDNKFQFTAEYRKIKDSYANPLFDNLDPFNFASASVDQNNPDFSGLDAPGPVSTVVAETFDQDDDRYGFSGQVLLRPHERLSFLLGGRVDHIKQRVDWVRFDPDPDDGIVVFQFDEHTDNSITHFTPRVAGVLELSDAINAYASYSSGFVPQTGVTRDGGSVGPETGTQYEAGLKGEFFGGALGATLSAFHIKRKNVVTQDPDNDRDESFQIGGREQRHSGYELEIFGQPIDGLSIAANYAYLVTEITADVDATIGGTSGLNNSVLGAPRNSGGVFLTYEIPQGPLAGLALGGGVYYVGTRPSQERAIIAPFGGPYVDPPALPGDPGFTIFHLQDYTTVDLSIHYYGFENLVFSVEATNVLNEDFFNVGTDCCGGNYLNRGRGREVLGTIKASF